MKKSPALSPKSPALCLKQLKKTKIQTFNDLGWDSSDEIDLRVEKLENISWTACTGGCGHSDNDDSSSGDHYPEMGCGGCGGKG